MNEPSETELEIMDVDYSETTGNTPTKIMDSYPHIMRNKVLCKHIILFCYT